MPRLRAHPGPPQSPPGFAAGSSRPRHQDHPGPTTRSPRTHHQVAANPRPRHREPTTTSPRTRHHVTANPPPRHREPATTSPRTHHHDLIRGPGIEPLLAIASAAAVLVIRCRCWPRPPRPPPGSRIKSGMTLVVGPGWRPDPVGGDGRRPAPLWTPGQARGHGPGTSPGPWFDRSPGASYKLMACAGERHSYPLSRKCRRTRR